MKKTHFIKQLLTFVLCTGLVSASSNLPFGNTDKKNSFEGGGWKSGIGLSSPDTTSSTTTLHQSGDGDHNLQICKGLNLLVKEFDGPYYIYQMGFSEGKFNMGSKDIKKAYCQSLGEYLKNTLLVEKYIFYKCKVTFDGMLTNGEEVNKTMVYKGDMPSTHNGNAKYFSLCLSVQRLDN